MIGRSPLLVCNAVLTFTFMRLWSGSGRREWPGSGAVHALDQK